VRADLPTAPSTIETDYAPAFSPDGQQVAYLRAINTVEFLQGVAQYRPISVMIRAVNFDGSNDRLVLLLSPGIFSSQLSWSPDGRQIVFETGQQPVPKPLEGAQFESLPNTLQLSLVNADGSNPHLLRGVSGGLPAWRPAVPEDFRVSIELVRGGQPSLVLTWPTQTDGVGVESSPKVGPDGVWTREAYPIFVDGSHTRMTLPIPAGNRYYRLFRYAIAP
jgi:dipeptidyl aminopeptidase/acylaminoacyl peptidase